MSGFSGRRELLQCPCGTWFRRRAQNHKFCKRCVILNQRHHNKDLTARRREGRDVMADVGSPACPTCGQGLSSYAFGSDPRNGVSTVYCPQCGEQPLPRYGTVRYDQERD